MSIDLSRIAQGHRKVLIKVNGAGVEKILSSYNKVKNDPEYVGRNKEVIPDGTEYTGVIATNTFTSDIDSFRRMFRESVIVPLNPLAGILRLTAF